MAELESLMQKHFVDYASYFVLDRAIPDLRDGLKPVQRRILHTLFTMEDGRYHKVANAIGETMKLHPHGDASIGDALIVLANKGFFIDRQGNFGNLLTGHPAAAARYVECRLMPMALDALFNEPLTEWRPSYDGRTREPIFLPSKLPVALMLGSEGIAVGMSTRILPHNLCELWDAQVACLRGKDFELYPDFHQGGEMDASDYDDGRGRVELRARIEAPDRKHVVIREIPYGTTTESVIASIETAVSKGRVKISSINDFTTDRAEIELTLSRGAESEEVVPQLYAYTDCGVSIVSNLVLIKDRRPELMTVSEVLKDTTKRLKAQLKAELEYEKEQLSLRRHRLTLEQIFVEQKVYKRLEKVKTEKGLRQTVKKGMEEFASLFVRAMAGEDLDHLLSLRIRRISAYDLERSRSQVEEVLSQIADIDGRLADMTRTAIRYVEGLREKYGDLFPRRTQRKTIEAVDKRAVARPSIKLSWDRESGFFGSAVKGEKFVLQVSEYDLVLLVAADGSYRITPPPEKMLFESRLLYAEVFDPKKGVDFVVAYRDKKRMAYAKRIHIEKFIRGREYHLIKEKAGKVDLLVAPEQAGTLHLEFVPAPRQRVSKGNYDLGELEPVGVTARGVRIAAKPVRKVRHEARKPGPRRRSARKKKVRSGSGEAGEGGQASLF